MHTTSLATQLNAAAPVQTPRANAQPAADGIDFGAALTRQIEQRQIEQRQAQVQPQPQAQAPAPMPQAAAAPKPQAGPKPAASDAKPAPREAAKQAPKEAQHAPAGKTEGADAGKSDKAVAAEGESTDEAATAADARAADSVVDMLALVASFNQVQQAAATVTPAALPTPDAQTAALLPGLTSKAAEGSEPLVQLESDGLLAVTPDAPQAQASDKAQPGIDLRALDLGKAADTAKLPAENADFAAKLRDTTAAQASVKDAAPGMEALTSLSAQATALQSAQSTGNVPPDRLSARVGTPAWDNQLGQKVVWMVGGEDQSATLELNPPDLGPVQVVLNVSNDMASVTFSSQQLEVRQALENALPRLREMMSESGIALGDALVNAGSEGRHGQDGQGAGSGRGHGGKGGGGEANVAEVTPRARTRVIGGAGAVDTFA